MHLLRWTRDWLKISRLFFIQSEVKQSSKMSTSRAFSRALLVHWIVAEEIILVLVLRHSVENRSNDFYTYKFIYVLRI